MASVELVSVGSKDLGWQRRSETGHRQGLHAGSVGCSYFWLASHGECSGSSIFGLKLGQSNYKFARLVKDRSPRHISFNALGQRYRTEKGEMTRMYKRAVWKDEVAVWMYQRAKIASFFCGKMGEYGTIPGGYSGK